jgi:hypothetical protein
MAICADILAPVQGSQSLLLDEQEFHRIGGQFRSRKNVSTASWGPYDAFANLFA